MQRRHFRPNAKISRSELATLITRAFKLTGTGTASFKDVKKEAWYYNSIDALASNKIITGYEDSTFKLTLSSSVIICLCLCSSQTKSPARLNNVKLL
ncbi:S-layer homology domain-containing protein [Paenibacillus tritici]|uniref:S-layer homology domain-containing protein n=1 Tax=Paenibacillus tritici TaxID=1873425 RepID=UPI001BADD7C7|nr:S-layer homology domain-containing protein [Paenibacillus tritici]